MELTCSSHSVKFERKLIPSLDLFFFHLPFKGGMKRIWVMVWQSNFVQRRSVLKSVKASFSQIGIHYLHNRTYAKRRSNHSSASLRNGVGIPFLVLSRKFLARCILFSCVFPASSPSIALFLRCVWEILASKEGPLLDGLSSWPKNHQCLKYGKKMCNSRTSGPLALILQQKNNCRIYSWKCNKGRNQIQLLTIWAVRNNCLFFAQ